MSDISSESSSVPPDQPVAANSTDGSSLPIDSAESLASTNTDAANNSAEEGLPDWEPLTPEIVEDEAVRGDFVIRWAVVLLALLFGCRQIVETTTLLRVKSGQYLAGHGWWPPANDVFSSVATDHRWINLSWLWDLILSGLFAIGDGIGVSLMTALIVAVTWWFLGRTSLAGVSNWWGSILGALTLLACQHQFSGQSETLTLLGLALLLHRLRDWKSSVAPTSSISESGQASDSALAIKPVSLWWLVPGFALWSNLDPRMFLGLSVLLLWGLGDWIGLAFGRAVLDASDRKTFWMVFAACVVASLLNPFGWHALGSPMSLYGIEYPALRHYTPVVARADELAPYSLLSPAVWRFMGQPLMAGVVVWLAAVIGVMLNFRKANFADVAVLVGVTLFAVAASHELAAAAVVACVIGTLNAQQWYQSKFRQTYSIELRELLFTRGGRAVTVLALFILAVFAVNHRLFESSGKYVGVGLSASLKTMIAGYQDAVQSSFDDRPFNFVPIQGDVLIWLNQKPFVDSRLAMYSGSDDGDLLALHERTRRSLTASKPDAQTPDKSATTSATDADPAEWASVFDRYQITHVIPRLVGVRPVTYLKLLTSGDWRLTHVGSMCGVLYRPNEKDQALKDYLAERQVQFVKTALKTDSPLAGIRTDWPRAPTAFQKYVSPSAVPISGSALEAANLLLHLQVQLDEPNAAAIALLAIRKANASLADSSQHALAFEVLGDAYTFLYDLEIATLQGASGQFINQLRFYQALGAYQQAALLSPNSLPVHQKLMSLYDRTNRIDLALRELDLVERLSDELGVDDPDQLRARLQRREQLLTRQDTMSQAVEKALERGDEPMLVGQQVYQAGFVLEALKLFDRDSLAVKESVQAQALRGLMLFESGQVETAFRQFEYESDSNPSTWRVPAAWTNLAHGDYDKAMTLLRKQMDLDQLTGLNYLVRTLPLLQTPMQAMEQIAPWPVEHTANVATQIVQGADEQSQLLWYTSMSLIEAGRTRVAAKMLQGLLDSHPTTFLRPLVRFYLFLLTDDLIDAAPPTESTTIEDLVVAPEETSETQKTDK